MPSITRRDFLNGTALAIVSGLTPAAQLGAAAAHYPPALTGMRGQHLGSFEIAHAFARESQRFGVDEAAAEESYDLVVVGGGISGLSAAWFYRRAVGPQARILILDNHDDFGGHAKRNEFVAGPHMLIGYGGSQSIQSPKTLWSDVAKGLLRDIGVDIMRFETAFEHGFYSSLGLSRGVFFDRETFGRDTLIADDPLLARRTEAGAGLAKFVAAAPLADLSKRQLLSLYDPVRDPLAGKSAGEKLKILKATSYRDYLIKLCGCSEEVANCFQGRPLGFFGLGCDAVPAFELRSLGYPGFAGLGLPSDEHPEWNEPYIYHFPDGNASLARLLVRALVPDVAAGRTMDDIVLAGFDYDRLDRNESSVRIRLASTVVDVRQRGEAVSIGYVRDGAPHRVTAKHAVLACFHMMIPYLMPDLPQAQREALARNVKTPLVYTNVVTRNWQPWLALKVSDIAAPMSFFNHVALDFPVDLGGYRHPRDPAEPIVLHLEHVPGAPNSGLDARAQFHIGQAKLFAMTFADFEIRIRDQLDRMLGPGGFDSERDIAAITVNRWPHGYGYVENSLFDGDDYEDRVLKLARQPFGRVAIANSDAAGDAYAHLAINEAARAVQELVS
ncbi:MAG TPA: FAD/NAD(P)-binding protein [Xanthobacteraceae bacterium]|jgi:spermidine dehydrogenase|nr:FAD/NAD(P)-binding protein [Xanthobacteraceae bacterium]